MCVAVMNIASIHGLKDDVKEVKDEMKKISTILANQAAYDVRLATLEAEVVEAAHRPTPVGRLAMVSTGEGLLWRGLFGFLGAKVREKQSVVGSAADN